MNTLERVKANEEFGKGVMMAYTDANNHGKEYAVRMAQRMIENGDHFGRLTHIAQGYITAVLDMGVEA